MSNKPQLLSFRKVGGLEFRRYLQCGMRIGINSKTKDSSLMLSCLEMPNPLLRLKIRLRWIIFLRIHIQMLTGNQVSLLTQIQRTHIAKMNRQKVQQVVPEHKKYLKVQPRRIHLAILERALMPTQKGALTTKDGVLLTTMMMLILYGDSIMTPLRMPITRSMERVISLTPIASPQVSTAHNRIQRRFRRISAIS